MGPITRSKSSSRKTRRSTKSRISNKSEETSNSLISQNTRKRKRANSNSKTNNKMRKIEKKSENKKSTPRKNNISNYSLEESEEKESSNKKILIKTQSLNEIPKSHKYSTRSQPDDYYSKMWTNDDESEDVDTEEVNSESETESKTESETQNEDGESIDSEEFEKNLQVKRASLKKSDIENIEKDSISEYTTSSKESNTNRRKSTYEEFVKNNPKTITPQKIIATPIKQVTPIPNPQATPNKLVTPNGQASPNKQITPNNQNITTIEDEIERINQNEIKDFDEFTEISNRITYLHDKFPTLTENQIIHALHLHNCQLNDTIAFIRNVLGTNKSMSILSSFHKNHDKLLEILYQNIDSESKSFLKDTLSKLRRITIFNTKKRDSKELLINALHKRIDYLFEDSSATHELKRFIQNEIQKTVN